MTKDELIIALTKLDAPGNAQILVWSEDGERLTLNNEARAVYDGKYVVIEEVGA